MNKSVMIRHDTFETLFPILHLSRFTCIFPLKWQKQNFGYIITISKFYVICSLLFTGFIVLYGIYGSVQIDVIYSVQLQGGVTRYIRFTDNALVLSTFAIAVATTAYKTDQYIQYFRYLTKCDQLLQRKSPKTYTKGFFTLSIVVTLCAIFISDLVVWMNWGSSKQSVYLRLSYLFPYYLAYFSIFVTSLIYCHLVYSIKIRLSVLNNRFQAMHNGGTIAANIRKKHIYTLIQAYENLTHCGKTVSRCHGFVILIILCGCAIHLLVTSYNLRRWVSFKFEVKPVIEQCIWISLHFIRLMLVVEPCHGCLEELKEMSNVLCQLLLYRFDDDTKKSLNFFLLYLSHCKIEFSAYGLVKIDRSLLPMIVGAITTYLVVLFQFN